MSAKLGKNVRNERKAFVNFQCSTRSQVCHRVNHTTKLIGAFKLEILYVGDSKNKDFTGEKDMQIFPGVIISSNNAVTCQKGHLDASNNWTFNSECGPRPRPRIFHRYFKRTIQNCLLIPYISQYISL